MRPFRPPARNRFLSDRKGFAGIIAAIFMVLIALFLVDMSLCLRLIKMQLFKTKSIKEIS